MHLTFVSSEGLEQSALSILSTVQKSDRDNNDNSSKMTFEDDDDGDTDCLYDSDGASGFLVINENSPLLLNLDPPGTVTRGGVKSNTKRRGYNSLLNFKIRRGPSNSKGVPLVVVITGLGMAAMVILGFLTMFQDKTSIDPTVAPVPASVIEEIGKNASATDAANTEMPIITIPNDQSPLNNSDNPVR